MRLEVTAMVLDAPPRAPVPKPRHSGWIVAERRLPSPEFLAFYRAVGASVAWDGRLRLSPADLARHLQAPSTRVFLLEGGDPAADAAGFCEFEDCGPEGAALAHFGLLPSHRGTGLGRLLLHHALAAVWRPGTVIRLETDTNDDPRAVGVYRDAGFRIVERMWKSFPD